jgi:hypothetical protein
MAKAGIYHVTIHRGTDWCPVITVKVKSTGLPKDLTSCKAWIEAFVDDWDGTQVFALSSEDTPATIALGGVAGTITPSLTDTETAALDAGRGKWFLDIEWATGKRQRLIAANLYISEDIVTPEPTP